MKQLTQAVFDLPDCPPDAESAAVDSDGEGYYYPTTKDQITPDIFDFWVYKNRGHGFEYGFQKIKGEFDTTDWQNSAINRESKSSKNGEQ